jgi:hypothetical protein
MCDKQTKPSISNRNRNRNRNRNQLANSLMWLGAEISLDHYFTVIDDSP